MRVRLCLAAALSLLCVVRGEGQSDAPRDVRAALIRISQYVQDYYSRAQSLIGTERVVVQPVSRTFGLDGFARTFINELLVEWTPREDGAPAMATMLRKRVTVNGRVPKPKDTPECTDPLSEQVEPLSMFLPEFGDEYEFIWKGERNEKEGRMMLLEFRERPAGPATSEWREVKGEDCVMVSLPGAHAGRVWADPATGAVSRLEMHLKGPVDVSVPRNQQHKAGAYVTVERSDYAIRYRSVTFQDPDETLLLPASIDVVRTYRNALMSSRVTQAYTDYRRFLGSGRLVE